MRIRILSRASRLVLAVIMVLSMVAIVIPSAGAVPTTYYVDIAGGSDAANGTSEATAWKTLDRAFEGPGTVPASGDTVMVLPGTYSESNGDSFPVSFIPGVTLESKMGPDVTFIDGEGSVSDFFFRVEDSVANTVIQGFTFKGNAEYSCLLIERNVASDIVGWPLIEGNVFVGNDESCIYIEGHGAGDQGAKIVDNEFYDNGDELGYDFADDGSCIYINDGASPVIEYNYFHDNYADDATVYFTGDAKPWVAYNTFENNEAANNGGAIWVDNADDGTMSIVGNDFEGNIAGNDGGAISSEWDGNLDIRNNQFDSNEAGQDGGAIAITNDCTATIDANDIHHNSSADDGGAIYLGNSVATITNNKIGANECEGGGGAVFSGGSDVDFFNNTVLNNSSTAPLGWNGIYHEGPNGIDISNSILWGHGNEDAKGTTIRYSCTQDPNPATSSNTVGAGMIHTAPTFYDSSVGDVRLVVGSSCIDVGTNSDAPAADFEGNPRPADGDGNGTATADMGAWERPTLAVGRVFGADRYATAAQVAKDTFDSATIAIVASGQNFPDALSAAGLCGAHEAPLLLTRTASLPPVTAQTLVDLGVTDVIIVGGTGAVSAGVETALKVDYDVTRIAGVDRYETSALIAEEVAAVSGDDFSFRAFIARGDAFPDALAVSPYAYADISPILLVRPATLPNITKAALEDLKIEDAAVCGGTGAVSDAVKDQVDAVLKANTSDANAASVRWGGADRYATAVEVATNAAAEGFGSFDYVGIATGSNFPDALAGGVSTGAMRGVVLLTRTSTLPASTAGELTKNGPMVVWCDIFGGDGAVAPAVKTAVFDALGW